MDLTASLALDWRTWDSVETVTFESTRPSVADSSGNAPDTGVYSVIPWAKRLDLTARELAASGGAYIAGDVTWLIPGTYLKAAKVGDAIQVSDTERWNVLTTAFIREDAVWELTARNPVIAYDLRDVIDIERATIVYDAAGAAIKEFPTVDGVTKVGVGKVIYPSLICKIQPIEADIAEERGMRGTQTKYQAFLSRQVEVTCEDRVLWGGRYLEIMATHNPQRIDELPYLDLILRV